MVKVWSNTSFSYSQCHVQILPQFVPTSGGVWPNQLLQHQLPVKTRINQQFSIAAPWSQTREIDSNFKTNTAVWATTENVQLQLPNSGFVPKAQTSSSARSLDFDPIIQISSSASSLDFNQQNSNRPSSFSATSLDCQKKNPNHRRLSIREDDRHSALPDNSKRQREQQKSGNSNAYYHI